MPYLTEPIKDGILNKNCVVSTPGELTFLVTHTLLENIHDLASFQEKLEGVRARYFECFGGKEYMRFSHAAKFIAAIECTAIEFERRNPYHPELKQIMNLLEDAKLNFYYDYVADYEDQKIKENGDVYA